MTDHIRAYATNSAGSSCGKDSSIPIRMIAGTILRINKIPWGTEYALAGHLNNGEAVYVKNKGGYCIEKDHRYLVAPTPAELAEIQYLQEPNPLAPARGIAIGMLVGSALWVVIAIVIYFTYFRG